MRSRLAVLSWLAATAAAFGKPATCDVELGAAAAATLVRQCREVSLSARSPCRTSNSCDVLRAEVAEGCRVLGADAPPFCEDHLEPDGEDDDE